MAELDGGAEDFQYDAFISYGNGDSGELAAALWRGLRQLAKPWYKLRVQRIFLDKADLPGSPNLGAEIERALSDSRWLVLIASPAAAASQWVTREVQWWLDHGRSDRLLIASTTPDLWWDERACDWADGALVPPALRGALRTEPRIVDLTEEASSKGQALSPVKVSFIAAPIRGRKPFDLVGDDLRQRRRARQLVTVAVSLLAALTVASATLTALVVRAYHNAIASKLTAQSEAFAAEAQTQRYTDPQTAALLALAAWRSSPTIAARSSLLSIMTDGYGGTLIGANDVYRAAFSPDGRYLATTAGVLAPGGHPDSTVRLWDVRTRRQVAVFPVNGTVTSVAFSPDGRTLAAAALGARTVWFWHVTSRRLARTLGGSGANALAYSPDGRLLAIDVRGKVGLIDLATMTRIAVLPGGFTDIDSLAFSGNGRLLAAGGETGSIANPLATLPGLTRVWNVTARTLLATLPASGTVNSVAFSSDSRLLASGSDNGIITLWNAAKHRMLAPLSSAGAVDAVAFSPDGLALVAAYGQVIKAWHVTPRSFIGEDTFFHPTIFTLAFSQAGQTLFAGGTDEAILLSFDHDDLSTPAIVTSTAVSPDGRLIATGGLDGKVRLWTSAGPWPVRVITADRGGVRSVSFSPHGRLLASGGAGGYVRLWNPATGTQLAALRAVGPAVTRVTFSPDGSLVVAASQVITANQFRHTYAPAAIQIWDAGTRKLLATFRAPWGDAVTGPVFAPNGSRIAVALNGLTGETVELLRSRDLHAVGAELKLRSLIYDVAFSPTSNLMATGLEDGAIVLWDAARDKRVRTITGISGQVRAVAFSPDDRTLAVGDSEGLIQIFSVRTGALEETLSAHTAEVNGLAFTPDGRTLISASTDHTAIIWTLSTRSAVQALCNALRGPDLARQWANLNIGIGPPPC